METECAHCTETITGDDWSDTWSQLVGHMIADHQLDPASDYEIIDDEEGVTAIKFIEPNE